MKYILIAYVNDLFFNNNDGSVVTYAKAIFSKETKNGRTLEVFRASKDLEAYDYIGTECTPLFDERGRVTAFM